MHYIVWAASSRFRGPRKSSRSGRCEAHRNSNGICTSTARPRMNEETQTPGGVEMIGAESVAAVLSEVAEIAAETLELQDVFDRVATAVRRVIPFDNMGVVRIVDGDKAVLHASTVPCRAESTRTCLGPASLTSWSPRMRPRPGPN